MSGHSKWASIKHQKGATDAKRAKVFTRLGHAVTIAARLGGGDATTNPRLALAVDMAKKNNMPKDNIDRAIKRGTGELGGAIAEDITYEGYGPGGTAILIETLTDNRNRTVNEIRNVFNKLGGKLGEAGSVAYLFKPRGVITVAKEANKSEEIEMAIIESGADDYQETDEGFIVLTDPQHLTTTKAALEAAGLSVIGAEQAQHPTQTMTITDEKIASQIVRLMNALEELDDISNVSGNFAIDDALLEKIEST